MARCIASGRVPCVRRRTKDAHATLPDNNGDLLQQRQDGSVSGKNVPTICLVMMKQWYTWETSGVGTVTQATQATSIIASRLFSAGEIILTLAHVILAIRRRSRWAACWETYFFPIRVALVAIRSANVPPESRVLARESRHGHLSGDSLLRRPFKKDARVRM